MAPKRFPTLCRLLTPEQIGMIHDGSLEILDRVGFEVPNDKVRRILLRHGCRTDPGSSLVKYPKNVVEKYRALFPSEFTFYGLDPVFDRTLPGDGPTCMPGSTAPFVIDPITCEKRPSTSTDIARIARMVHEFSGFDIFPISVLAEDYAPGYRHLARLYPTLKNCKKPIRLSGTDNVEEIEKILRLCHIVAGGKDAYMARPFITHLTCPIISPLKMEPTSIGMLVYFTENRLPNYFPVVPNAGLTSPMSLVGTLAQANAEFLAVAVLMQMVHPGTPLIYCALPTVADLRTGDYTPGAIETAMLSMGSAQLADFYNIPYDGLIGMTNSKIPDAQSGFEKAMSVTAGMLGGVDNIEFGGFVEALVSFDYAQIVIDDEIAQMLKRLARGYEFSPKELELSIDVIETVRPGGEFMTHRHTFERMKSVSFFPEIADRSAWHQWEAGGRRDALQRALGKVQQFLKKEHPSFLSSEVTAQINMEFSEMVAGDLIPFESIRSP